MSLRDDAGSVGKEGVSPDNEVGWERVPDNKNRDNNHLQPVGELAATGFDSKLSKVLRVA